MLRIIWRIFLVFLLVVTSVYVLHYILPESARWLSREDIDSISSVIPMDIIVAVGYGIKQLTDTISRDGVW